MAEVEYEVRGHVAYITLNRPDAANALNAEVARQLDQAALACDENADVRVALMTGAGRMFCGGGDLKAFAAQPAEQLPAYLKLVTLHFHQAIHRFARMQAPLVVAVNGNAGGGGMSLALAGDIVLAAESARFTMAYTRVGLTPDGSSTYTLPRLIGLRRAAELMLTNRTLSAREAEQIGLVTRVVPDADLRQQAEALVQELSQGATRAFGGVKRLLYSSATASLAEQMELETEWIAEMARRRDAHEGISAFLAKRAPKFTGS
jgi:2-(1,2-epoxy-1,2-dihydrophenyl)acetyl-CoA isomerase